jgi:xylulokinase
MSYYVGIDIGTSSAKITLIDGKGSIIKECNGDYSLTELAPGWKEIDPEIWMTTVDECMKELLQGIDAKEVASIGVTGQMHTVIFLDENGKSIRPALMWNDTRTSLLVPKVKDKIMENSKISYISNIISTGSPAMNLLWVKKNEPKNFSKIHKFLIGPDYIVFRLTGTIQTDYCEASTSSLCDLHTGTWSPEMRKIMGFPEGIYPQIKGSGQMAGTITDEWVEKLGLCPEVTVTVGTGDNPAAAISTGCFTGKYPVLSFGTSGVLMIPKEEVDLNAKGKNILFSVDGKEIQVLVQGVVQSCGSSFAWWMKNVLNTTDFNGETLDADLSHLGESNIIFYPHLVGDKTIYADPNIRGAFIGIGTETTRKDMSIAIMEGICMAVRQLIEAMKIPRKTLEGLRVIGGGSKNEVWMQILADVLDISVVQLESGSGAGYGIALTAAANSSTEISMEEILKNTISTKKTFYPRNYNVKLYNHKYRKYLRIYSALKHIY